MCFASESFILLLPFHRYLNLMSSFRLVNMNQTLLSSSLAEFHAAAARVFNLTVQDLFDQDDLL